MTHPHKGCKDNMITVINDKVVSVEIDDPEKITSVIERSREVDGKVWVYLGMGEMLILKNMGYDPPSPIRTQYDYPGKYKPFAHQVATAEFLTLNRKCFVLNEMGTGKTSSAIWAIDYLMTLGIIKRALVIAPLSILDAAWKREFFKTAMHRKVEIAHGARAKRAAIIESDAEVVIINFDGVGIVHKEIDRGGFDLIVIDEATAYKNVATDRWKTLNKLIKDETYLIAMTGTPAAQSPADAYGLAKLINPKGVPRAFNAFRDLVQVKTSLFTYKNRPDAEQTVYSVLQPAIRFTQAECLDLPELVYQTREVPLSLQQSKYYKMLKKEMLMEISGQEISAANAAVAMNKLLQVSAGCVYTDEGEVVEFDVTNRLNELLSVVDETSHKVIVFVMYKHTIELVQKHLQAEGHTVDVIHGGISANKRATIFNDFQTQPDPRILVIQPQAASHGVTLHAANCIIWWGITLSLETYLQANARIHRQGQVNNCTMVHLIGSSVEKKVLGVLENKGAAQTKLLTLFKEVLE